MPEFLRKYAAREMSLIPLKKLDADKPVTKTSQPEKEQEQERSKKTYTKKPDDQLSRVLQKRQEIKKKKKAKRAEFVDYFLSKPNPKKRPYPESTTLNKESALQKIVDKDLRPRYKQVYKTCLANGMTEEDAKQHAETYTRKRIRTEVRALETMYPQVPVKEQVIKPE
jgi:hypothetical protein